MTRPTTPETPTSPRQGNRRRTSPRVRIVDALAKALISVGGIAVIIAVTGILLYLVVETFPMFVRGSLGQPTTHRLQLEGRPLAGVSDEYRGSVLFLTDRGRATAVDPQSGRTLFDQTVSQEGRTVTSVSAISEGGAIAIGYDDGRVQIGVLGFATDFITKPDEAAAFESVKIGERFPTDGGYITRTPEGQLRRTRVSIELADPIAPGPGSGAVVRLDYRITSTERYLLVMREDGSVGFSLVRMTTPLGGGKPRVRTSNEDVAFALPAGVTELPQWLFVTGDAAHILALWPDGLCQRYSREAGSDGFVLLETADLAPQSRHLTSADLLLGGLTLVLGDDAGGVSGVFPARIGTTATPDGIAMGIAHRFEAPRDGAAAPITAIGVTQRDRSFIVGDAQGRIVVRNMTSGKLVVAAQSGSSSPIVISKITPKIDGLITLDESGMLTSWPMDSGHPDASLAAFFGRIWYEGEPGPAFVYQASAGTDNAEPKMSLVPLIFGTLKATVYAMLFAVPIAVLAAIYTSDMLHPRVRLTVKPVIEMMASLPSVVLGFVAAMVISPFARDYLAPILMAFLIVPTAGLLAANLWQLLPVRITSRLRTWQHLILVAVVMVVALAASFILGNAVERALFRPSEANQLVLAGSVEVVPPQERPAWASGFTSLTREQERRLSRENGLAVSRGEIVRPIGSVRDPAVAEIIRREELDQPSIRLWLDGLIGDPRPGWLVLMAAPGIIIAAFARSRFIDPRLGKLAISREVRPAAWIELAKFGVTWVGGLGVAWLMATLLTDVLGMDARDSVFGPYTQRNTLIVAIVMGFAVIPIIYTISEDAMSSVPGQLRSASLGCGATRWQTAVRVVLPLALSGIFSACMIGLGRAAGETMIVLMATGNTASMDWNMFSGFRTLSANIAVELPEAPKGETHYRMLFLAALCLFIMTFIVNTAAELVRRRVRKRGAGL